jgi:hypothetical protein
MYKKDHSSHSFPFSIAHSTFLWGDIPVSFTGSNILLKQAPTAVLAIFYKNKKNFLSHQNFKHFIFLFAGISMQQPEDNIS